MKARRCIEVMIASRGPIAFFVRKTSRILPSVRTARQTKQAYPAEGSGYQSVPMFKGHAPL